MQFHYTPQQMAGSVKYHHKCRIGNWNEDTSLEEETVKNFLSARETQTLTVSKLQAVRKAACAPVSLTPPNADGYVHDGDVVNILSKATEAFLAVDSSDNLGKADMGACALNASPEAGSVVRNSFKIEKKDASTDQIIRYGEQVILTCSDLFLASAKASVLTGTQSRTSGRQEVFAASDLNQGALWTILYHDPRMVLEMTGEPVPANAALCLKHSTSGILLCCDSVLVRNHFGGEYEVCCMNTYSSNDRKQILAAEASGRVGETVKFVHPVNIFYIVNK